MQDGTLEILSQYDERKDLLDAFSKEIESYLTNLLTDHGLKVCIVARRVKTRKRLEAKLRRKLTRGKAYECLENITDVVGLRVVTYLSDDAEKVGRLIRLWLSVDWKNSEDKRDRLKAEEFGYRSDHYIVSFTDDFCTEHGYTRFTNLKAEVQVRTLLQHAWAEIEHDELGYAAEDMVPHEVRRRLARAAAVLDSVDEELSELRSLVRPAHLTCLRAEGLTEPIGEFEFSLDPRALRSGSDLVISTNTNITASIGEEQEILLVVEDSAQSVPIRGVPHPGFANTIVFPGAFPRHVAQDLRWVRCKVRGMRVNSHQLGIAAASSPPTKVSIAVVNEPKSKDVLRIVAVVRQGLYSSVSFDGLSEAPFSAHRLALTFSEGFAGSFKNAFRETGADRTAKAGTRLMAQFTNLPQKAELWVSASNVGFPISPQEPPISARLVPTDPNGAGFLTKLPRGRAPINQGALHMDIEDGGCVLQLVRVELFNGAAIAVWEISDETIDADCARSLKFLAYLKTETPAGAEIQCTQNFAPLSCVGTASHGDPVPRFAPGANARTIKLGD